MAHADNAHGIHGLKLDTQSNGRQYNVEQYSNTQQRPSHVAQADGTSHSSSDAVRATATPPIDILPQYDEHAIQSASPDDPSASYIEEYLKNRATAISFHEETKTDSGHRHSILEPPRKPARLGSRGRSIGQAIQVQKNNRAHSESDRSHYDPFTGRHLPQWSNSPPREEPRIGEARFPLLQKTVDELARQSQINLHGSDVTAEPETDDVSNTLQQDSSQVSSPIAATSPFPRFSSSYESPHSQRRKASERWRDGETSTNFFARAGSVKNLSSLRDSDRRFSRRDTASSARSPRSAASSFLRGFSMSSGADGDRSTPPAVDAEGATIGEDYVLGKQIGYGGFSIIREATHMTAGSQRRLAVKIVRKEIEGKTEIENAAAQAEFEHEVDLWRLLNHKHILSLEAVYELKEATFCFIPLNTGGTLFDVVANNKTGLSDDMAASYSYQLASALRYLHLDARVVHRDVKLENCLIDTTKDSPALLRLCDFGLAEWISSDSDSISNPGSASPRSSLDNNGSESRERERNLQRYFGPAPTSSSAFAGGSLEYAAPEILKIASTSTGDTSVPPDKSIVDPAVDIWAMGVCVYSLLMGQRPFQDSFQPRVVMAILAGDWPKKQLKENADAEAYQLVKSCLSTRPESRPDIAQIYDHSWLRKARDEDLNENGGGNAGWRL